MTQPLGRILCLLLTFADHCNSSQLKSTQVSQCPLLLLYKKFNCFWETVPRRGTTRWQARADGAAGKSACREHGSGKAIGNRFAAACKALACVLRSRACGARGGHTLELDALQRVVVSVAVFPGARGLVRCTGATVVASVTSSCFRFT